MNIPFYEDVAVLFLSELALTDHNRKVPLSEIAVKHGISPLFLKKIARILRKSGFLHSKEGKNGGYTLAVDPSKTSLWDIYSAVDQSSSAYMKKFLYPYAPCPLNSICLPQVIRNSIRSSIQGSLEKVTLKTLIGKVQS